MKPHSIVFAIAFLTGCAMSRAPAVMPGGDYQASLKGMEAAQAQASQPGDENLTCDQLQEQMLAIAQDPALLEHFEASGAAAEKDLAQMQVGKGEIAAKSAATVMAATIPGADMGQMMAAATENQSRAAQGKARTQARMAEGQQMMGFMPKLMRGQRLIELGAARKCEWAEDIDMDGAQ
jgi:hypothetical protein